jgi:hypothetical protein
MAGDAIFLHDPGDFRPGQPGTVVALTAKAIEACRRAGVSPKVLDDLTERPEICRSPDAYQRWEIDWLKRLDDACRLNGVAQSCAQLLVPAVESLVINARMLSGAVDKLAPDSITYFGKTGPVEATGYHNGHLQFWPTLGDVPLAGRLLELIAASRSLLYAPRSVDEPGALVIPDSSRTKRVRRGLARSLGPLRRVYWSQGLGRTQRSTTLLLWYAGYGADQFAVDERAAGHNTAFITRGDRSFRVVDPGVPPHHAPGHRIDLTVGTVKRLDPALLVLLDEIDDWAGIPGAARILESRLAVFLHGICVSVRVAASQVLREFSRFGIDRIAGANPTSLQEFACLIAAKGAHIPSILVQHGDHLLPYGSWLVTETRNFDEFAASDPTMGDELMAAGVSLGVATPRVTYYAPRVTELVESVRSQRSVRLRPVRICYVPSFLFGESRSVSGCNFDDAWSHRWHLRVLELMARRPALHFTWKGLPSTDQAVDPIPAIIAERELRNVVYEARPFLKVAGEADRIFTDLPSTAIFESVHLGKPILALTFPRFYSVRPLAAARLAQVLRACDTEEDALAQISAFLDSDPSLWVLPQRNVALP